MGTCGPTAPLAVARVSELVGGRPISSLSVFGAWALFVGEGSRVKPFSLHHLTPFATSLCFLPWAFVLIGLLIRNHR